MESHKLACVRLFVSECGCVHCIASKFIDFGCSFVGVVFEDSVCAYFSVATCSVV